MLDEYFALKIDEGGLVREIPLLLRDYKPNLDKLPLLLMRLGPQVRFIPSPILFPHAGLGRLALGEGML
jgi:DNA mismatch repair protein Mlh1 C-terminus